jgi:two-component system, OmpR family, response regulator
VARKRILFVDHRPEHLAQPALRLQVAGYEVETSQTGRAAMETLRKHRFDLLILDSELPFENGWSLLKEVRQDAELSDLRVIVLMAAHGETQQLVLVPVDAELRRPFSLGELLDAVRDVIGEA